MFKIFKRYDVSSGSLHYKWVYRRPDAVDDAGNEDASS